MRPEVLLKRPALSPDVGGVNLVKHWQNQFPAAVEDLRELLKAPPGVGVPRREHDDGGRRVVDRFQKTRRDLVAAVEGVVVAKDAHTALHERVVEGVGDGVAGVFASEAQEHVPPEPETADGPVVRH
ncbi:hypothetical protein ACLB2K_022890 [Fragaria x ananassa]